MGKALALAALVAVFTVSAAACGSGGQEAEPSPTASPTPSPTPAVEMVKVATVTDIEGSLNIRSAASTDSEILSEAYAGDRFEVLTENYSEEARTASALVSWGYTVTAQPRFIRQSAMLFL